MVLWYDDSDRINKQMSEILGFVRQNRASPTSIADEHRRRAGNSRFTVSEHRLRVLTWQSRRVHFLAPHRVRVRRWSSIPHLTLDCLSNKLSGAHIIWVVTTQISILPTHRHRKWAYSQLWWNRTRPKNVISKFWSHRYDRNLKIYNSMRSEYWFRSLWRRSIHL